jgi:hypothetical protein
MLAVLGHRIGNLQGEFARGREDQSLHMSLRLKVLENGEGKGGGLAGAGLCLTDHIRAGEHDGDQRGLDGRRRGIAKLGNGLHDLVTQVEGGKFGCHLILLLPS